MSVDNPSGLVLQEQQKASDYENSDPVPHLQDVVPPADKTDLSQQELEFLFNPLFEEYFPAGNQSLNRKNIKEAMADSAWIEAMQEELHYIIYTSARIGKLVDLCRYAAHKGSSIPDQSQNILPTKESSIWIEATSRACTSGGIKFLGDKLVSWMSKKQDCTVMSSAEAEYVALSASYAQHSRTKHIHTQYHFIKEHVENGIIELYFVRTQYQLADMFTKALPYSEDRVSRIMLRRIWFEMFDSSRTGGLLTNGIA
ncbi:hypothetical protein Tco_1175899 [Tanacetum coccineum]